MTAGRENTLLQLQSHCSIAPTISTNRAGRMEGEPQPTRVVVHASTKGQHWTKAWESPEDVIEIALGLVKESGLAPPDSHKPLPRFLVKERYNTRIFVVFDIFHDLYDPDTAHIDLTNLPVILVYLGKTQNVRSVGSAMCNVINKLVRDVHDDTGLGSRPPFSVDHMDGNIPRYCNPRIPKSKMVH